jgi:hypothetical protein
MTQGDGAKDSARSTKRDGSDASRADVLHLPVVEDGGELDERYLLSPILVEETARKIVDTDRRRTLVVGAVGFVSGVLATIAVGLVYLLAAKAGNAQAAAVAVSAVVSTVVGVFSGLAWTKSRD